MTVFNAVYGLHNFCVLLNCRCCVAPIKTLKLSNSNNVIVIIQLSIILFLLQHITVTDTERRRSDDSHVLSVQ